MDYLAPNIPTDRGGLRQDRRAGSEEVFPHPSEGEGLQTPHWEMYWVLAGWQRDAYVPPFLPFRFPLSKPFLRHNTGRPLIQRHSLIPCIP